ncbi:hypothetical protein B0H19DRAFT_1064331 [Mycena capillaripes]|nr:hypothetical protein B0H19DRAFT_1064331 [Mycena capillaripes]
MPGTAKNALPTDYPKASDPQIADERAHPGPIPQSDEETPEDERLIPFLRFPPDGNFFNATLELIHPNDLPPGWVHTTERFDSAAFAKAREEVRNEELAKRVQDEGPSSVAVKPNEYSSEAMVREAASAGVLVATVAEGIDLATEFKYNSNSSLESGPLTSDSDDGHTN